MRLTYKDKYNKWCSDGSKASLQLGNPSENWPSLLWGDAVDKLAAYEDAEEQRRLLMLPCKVGDVIWWKNGHHIVDCYVVEIQISARRSEVIFKFGPQLDLKAGARFEDFGKTVFLTRKEAKAALKGEQDDG